MASTVGLRAKVPPVDGVMRYAVALPSDQTFVYLKSVDDPGLAWEDTTVHAEAKLWTDRAEAERQACAHHGWVDEVADVAEFNARPDTW